MPFKQSGVREEECRSRSGRSRWSGDGATRSTARPKLLQAYHADLDLAKVGDAHGNTTSISVKKFF